MLRLVDSSAGMQGTLVEQWCASQINRGFSKRTADRRRWTLSKLEAAIGRDPITCTVAELEEWLAGYHVTQTRYTLRADVHQYFKFAIRRGAATYDPTIEIDPPRLPKRLPNPVPATDVEMLIETAHGDTLISLLLAAHAGLRVSEIAKVHARDARDGCIIVRQGKGARDRSVPMSSELAAALPRTDEELFPGFDGQAISARIRRHFRRFDIAHRPHDLRASFGTALARRGVPIETIAQLMGHESLATTKAYLLLAAPPQSIVEGLFRSAA